MEMLRAALKSGRLDDMDWFDCVGCVDCVGGAAVLFPDRNGVPASEFGSRTLVGTGGGGGRWLGMYGGACREGAWEGGGGPWP